jgi:hypothetical protein
MADMDDLPRIFVIHSFMDNQFYLDLERDLMHDLGVDVATRVHSFASGDPVQDDGTSWPTLSNESGWWHKIVGKILGCDVVLVVLSPEAIASRMVRDEVALAVQQKDMFGKLIIPILYQPCAMPPELATLRSVSSLAPKPYNIAYAELWAALGLPAR